MKTIYHLKPLSPQRWALYSKGALSPMVVYKRGSKAQAFEEVTKQLDGTGACLVIHYINGTVERQHVFERRPVEPGTDSRWANKLNEAGQVKKVGRDYAAIT